MSQRLDSLRSTVLRLCVATEALVRAVIARVSWRTLVSLAIVVGGICIWVAGGPPNMLTDLLALIPAGRRRPAPRP